MSKFKSLYSITMFLKTNDVDVDVVREFERFKPLPNLPDSMKLEIVNHYGKLKKTTHRARLLRNVCELGCDFNYERFLRYEEFANSHPKDTSSLEMFQLRYGDELGLQKFNDKTAKSTHTIESFLEKYPDDGVQRYHEYNRRKRNTRERMIERYGEEEGNRRWERLCERNRGNHTLERRIEIHGEEEGRRLFEETRQKLKDKNTLDYYIKLYGEEDGFLKWNWRNLQNSISTMFTDKDMVWKIDTPMYSKWLERIGSKQLNDQSTQELRRYYRSVWRVTKRQPLHLLPNFDKRSHQRDSGTYAIDHKISIIYGFEENISPEIIGNINNLQMLPHEENSRKGRSCYSMLDYCYRGVL